MEILWHVLGILGLVWVGAGHWMVFEVIRNFLLPK